MLFLTENRRSGRRPDGPRKTTVRSGVLWGTLRGLSKVTPALVSRLLERLLMKPPRRAAYGVDEELRSSAHRFSVTSLGRRLQAWSWGEGPAVLLVHGWGGRGAYLGAFVRPLLATGARVITFDCPGHGASDGGNDAC